MTIRVSRLDLTPLDLSRLDSDSLLRTLADFRFELRRFLHFSEIAATEEGLHPQQHQLLLQVAGAPEGAVVTIAYAAERLGLRHNSVVELVNRSEGEGLLVRVADAADQRRALLRLTRKGKQALTRLSEDHAREIQELAPRLVRTLEAICAHERVQSKQGRQRGGSEN
jgi:DNA-binding MarR family transcriptional regulator